MIKQEQKAPPSPSVTEYLMPFLGSFYWNHSPFTVLLKGSLIFGHVKAYSYFGFFCG